jgi:hypothetical protein
MCAAHFAAPIYEVRYGGVMSWGLLVFFVWWLVDTGRAAVEEATAVSSPPKARRSAGETPRLRANRRARAAALV